MIVPARNAFRLVGLARPRSVLATFSLPRRHIMDSATGGDHRAVKFYGDSQRGSIPSTTPASTTHHEAHAPAQPLKASVHAALPPTMKSLSLFGKTVLVTGAARGLGNQMARACAEAGARAVIIFDANEQLGEQAAAELHEQSGVPVAYCTVDVRQAEAIDTAVADVVERWGVPDVLVNAAGIADSNIKAEMYDPQMFRRLIDINLTGTFLMSTSVARHMIKAEKPGSIILVASMSGSIVNYPQEQSCYNASKAGVIQFGKSIAAEWAKHKIRVNCISPGYMDTALNRVAALEAQKKVWTNLTPQNRLGGVHELNGLCVYLASDASAFMTGSNLLIDGGYSCW
ncbi:short-chain dehydrogenase [Ophiocordyceps camponoti-floridani]|uniref:Short-chain dehydrogenase n=1 Tax=Ophiocordyceps camponoti-floridani TaxID=2030778 RepID=A0A8H4VH36_9HYPO|nr:short-chain dehydrogenase [Ophiocordyceps camponoti-floridani]